MTQEKTNWIKNNFLALLQVATVCVLGVFTYYVNVQKQDLMTAVELKQIKQEYEAYKDRTDRRIDKMENKIEAQEKVSIVIVEGIKRIDTTLIKIETKIEKL
jgi:hypothetical protein